MAEVGESRAGAIHTRFRWASFAVATLGILGTFYVLSNGTWSLFTPEWMGLVYNDMFLALMDGRLDVRADLIRREGFYAEDGKVYAYFGLLPALLRGLWAPFVDLETVDVSRPTLWVLLSLSGIVSQWIVLTVCRRFVGPVHSSAGAVLVLVLCGFLWVAGPTMLLAANASIYHQPPAIGYLLILAFMLIVLRSLGEDNGLSASALLGLAVIAGLAVHTRPNVAIGLYAATVGFCVTALWQTYVQIGAASGASAILGTLRSRIFLIASLCMLVMLLAGLAFLGINWIKWGDPFITAPMDRYGVLLSGDGDAARFQSIKDFGSFNVRRIPANLALYALTLLDGHRALADMFNAGHIRLEPPFRGVLVVWCLPLFLGVRFMWADRGMLTGAPVRLLVLATALVAVMVLSFQTVAFRYMVDLFPFLFILMLVSLPGAFRLLDASTGAARRIYVAAMALLALIGSVFMISGVSDYKTISWFAAADSPVVLRP